MLKLNKLEADGNPIEIKQNQFSASDLSKEFVLVKRSEDDFFNEHPKDGVLAKLVFSHPKTKLKKFTSVQGEFKIRTGGKREVIKVPAKAAKKIKNAKLEKLDAKGKKPDQIVSTSWSGSEQTKNYSFQFDEEKSISDDLMIELSIATDLEELTVPFDLPNVSVVAEK